MACFSVKTPRCKRCALRLGTALPECGDCLREPPPFTQTVCAVDYEFPWDALIVAFKFQGQPELARALSPRLVDAVRHHGGALPQALLPVPLSSQRLTQRGYNQAWELARQVARTLRIPALPDVLQRPLDTAHQTELGRTGRQRNLRAAFWVPLDQYSQVKGQHLALVDDVMTTGATLREASNELLRAGAARVDAWVLARTPSAAG